MCADTPDTTLPEYKDTLFLPKTDFPMRAGLPKREPGWLARWEEIGVYDRLREKAKETNRAPFILHDGPPYANGHLHIGHALNKVLKDIVVRSQQMMGKDARYVPGWDCHGLPIEWKIEEQYRKQGKNKDDVPIVELRQECRKFADEWVDVQRAEFKRLGVTGAWDKPYLTMAYDAEATIASEFMTFLMNGSLYQGSKPVMWSPVEQTALAEAEVEYHDHKSTMIWVKFAIKSWSVDKDELMGLIAETGETDGAASMQAVGEMLQGAKVLIWTTTPWTIPQNRAVCFNPEVSYGLYEVTEAPEENWAVIGDRYLLADNCVEDAMKAARVTGYTRVRDITQGMLGQMTLSHPLIGRADNGEWDFEVPMLPGDHVTDDAGTGFVHTAPSHGDDDYKIGLKHGLPMTHNVLADGSYRQDLPLFGGAVITTPKGKEGDANKRVIEALNDAGGMFARGRLTHSYPHSWRSKAPLIFRNTPQWFAAIDKTLDDGMDTYGETIRTRALRSIDELVSWTPQTGRNRLYSMIEARPDWVLSRQRAWGVPLTCFTRKGAMPEDDDFLLRDPEVNARIVEAFRAEGADAWYADGAKARFLDGLHDPEAYEQVFDILDVWFDSGSTHAFVLRDREDGVADGIADLYLEGTDQHRGWFHSSMLQACGTKGRAPYRGVLTHGFTLDEKGNKMSKSLGNTIGPEQVIKQYGADILRLWVAESDFTVDQRIGPEILKGVADGYRRVRNSIRYLLGALGKEAVPQTVRREDMPELERYMLHRLAELDAEVRAAYNRYDFQEVVQTLLTFATGDLSAFYLDIRKDALYCDAPSSVRRQSALIVMDAILERLMFWLAPVLVFTMEEVWLERHGEDAGSIHLHDMPETPSEWLDAALAAKIDRVRTIRRVVTGALEIERREKRIGAPLEAAPVVYAGSDDLALLRSVPFEDICITSAVTLSEEAAPADAFRLDDVPGVAVVFARAHGAKCERCWKYLPDVGTHENPATCGRCNSVLVAL